MPLSEEQRQAIRDEEYFRHEVKQQLAGNKAPPGLLERWSAFFESKAGFWLLTTVLAGVTATGFTSLQRYLDRDEIAQREAADRARRDMDTLLKLGPMLTSEKRTQVDVAIVLLDGLTSDKALDARVATQVKALVQSTLETGLRKGASDEEKSQAAAIIAFADRSRVMAIQRADPEPAAVPQTAQSPLSAAIDNASLPVRIYLQIGDEDDRATASAAAGALRQAGFLVPGIERIPTKSAPSLNDLRYCAGKVDVQVLRRVLDAVAQAVTPVPRTVVLDPKLCGKVRFNHFEVWYALNQHP